MGLFTLYASPQSHCLPGCSLAGCPSFLPFAASGKGGGDGASKAKPAGGSGGGQQAKKKGPTAASGGKGGGGGGGKGGGGASAAAAPATHGPAVGMSSDNMALVQQMLGLGVGGSGGLAGGLGTAGGSSASLCSMSGGGGPGFGAAASASAPVVAVIIDDVAVEDMRGQVRDEWATRVAAQAPMYTRRCTPVVVHPSVGALNHLPPSACLCRWQQWHLSRGLPRCMYSQPGRRCTRPPSRCGESGGMRGEESGGMRRSRQGR